MSDKTPRSLLYNNLYRIPSARMGGHAYDGGSYFVTICTKDRECHFGDIVAGADGKKKMILSAIGQYADEQICNITTHCPYATVPLWVVMPNHVHLIVVIDGGMVPHKRRMNVETVCTPSLVNHVDATLIQDGVHTVSTNARWKNPNEVNEFMREISKRKGWLSVAIGGMKRAVTKFSHENEIPFAWQARFHDHVIRDREDMNRIADYITCNVQHWDEDSFYG